MSRCRYYVMLSVLFILTLTTIIPMYNFSFPNQIFTDSLNTQNLSVESYSEYSPIVVANDSDFSDQGWPGEGNKEQPYLIQGLNITTDGTCIEISNTSVHFS